MKTIQCNCGSEIEVNIPELYSTDTSPDLLQEILEGDFMSVRCDKCESIVKPELPAGIRDEEYGIDIQFQPETKRMPYLSGNVEIPQAERVVFGYPELVEKVLINMKGLKDQVIETIKYFYIQKAGPGSDLTIYLDSVSSAGLTFRIHGLKNDEIGIAEIKHDFYRKIENDLESILAREELEDVLSPPYVSINKVYLGEDEP